MRCTVWKDLEIVEAKRTSENWVDFAVLSSNFVCFSVSLLPIEPLKILWYQSKWK